MGEAPKRLQKVPNHSTAGSSRGRSSGAKQNGSRGPSSNGSSLKTLPSISSKLSTLGAALPSFPHVGSPCIGRVVWMGLIWAYTFNGDELTRELSDESDIVVEGRASWMAENSRLFMLSGDKFTRERSDESDIAVLSAALSKGESDLDGS